MHQHTHFAVFKRMKKKKISFRSFLSSDKISISNIWSHRINEIPEDSRNKTHSVRIFIVTKKMAAAAHIYMRRSFVLHPGNPMNSSSEG